MKTYELADALTQFARALKAGPAIDMKDLQERLCAVPALMDRKSMAVNLATLAALSHVDKHQWIEFVKDFSIPIEIRPRDASRDILGKLLKCLEENPEARRSLQRRAVQKEAEASPELMKALDFLLKDDAGEHSETGNQR